jgi:pimeloyl-ACP methyl ester carboxylesterase
MVIVSYVAFIMFVARHAKRKKSSKIVRWFSKKLLGENLDDIIAYVEENVVKLEAFPHEDVTITTDDGLKLLGNFFINEKPTENTVICMHGYTSNWDYEFSSIAQFYLKEGYNVLLPELRAHGRSEGRYIGFAALDRFDGLKWLKVVTDRFPNGKIFLTGVSMGGATVLQMSDLDLPKNVRGIIADCPFTTVGEEMSFQMKRLFHIPRFPILNMGEFFCKTIAGYDFHTADSRKSVKNAKVPILFIHGGNDVFIPLFMSEQCLEACSTDKKLVVVDKASHGASYYTDQELYESSVREFLQKHG